MCHHSWLVDDVTRYHLSDSALCARASRRSVGRRQLTFSQASCHYGAMRNTNNSALPECLSRGTERGVPAHQSPLSAAAAALGSGTHPSCLPRSTLGLFFSQQSDDNPLCLASSTPGRTTTTGRHRSGSRSTGVSIVTWRKSVNKGSVHFLKACGHYLTF